MCVTGKQTSDLLCLPLTQQELDCLSSHLEDKGHLDKLVVHHIQMGNLAEAVRLNKALNAQPLVGGSTCSLPAHYSYYRFSF